MILILTDSAREASLLSTLCEHRAWPCATGHSIVDFARLGERSLLQAVVVRQKLHEGYSDDVLRSIAEIDGPSRPRTIVLMPAGCSIAQEARQVALGADCVLRDPLRLEVLMEYLAKYRARSPLFQARSDQPHAPAYEFAGATVHRHELRLTFSGRSVQTTPRVIELVQLLHRMTGRVAPYAQVYSEVFDRRFTGDTSNCRVLLAKATADFRRLGLDLRTHIKVIPKSGYRYDPDK